MATYSSETVSLSASADNVYSKFSNLENLRSLLANVPAGSLPDDQKSMLEQIRITPDSITVPGGPVGSLVFKVSEKVEPSFIRLDAEGSPIALALAINITPTSADSCTAKVDIDIALPAMLKPMIGGQIQKMADQFGHMLKSIPFA